ncbi:tumor necrosis factor receptor superfamily member 13C [Phaenicophaeus curvirostris]|uniref:tumor necrosis factor receptor superfamily member 13C n=1 Tax=Phaenicophaeus curvirostris TaxID=33595 RepID=UPI0037F0CD1B
MREQGSRSHSTMSLSGKADAASSCLSSQCFDTLTKSCVECSALFKDNTTEPARVAPTSALMPTLSTVDLPRNFLIFGVLTVMGIILVLAALWGFMACKVGKKRRKSKVVDQEAEANVDTTSPLPSPGCQDCATLEADVALAPASCLHLNGGLKMPGPPGKAGAKRRVCCQGDADGDIILLSAVYPRHEDHNHSFPLPATELGATALVTTKTTQNCATEERA